MLVDFTQTASRLSAMPNYNAKYAIILSGLRTPFLLLEALPFISLLAALITFFMQNKSLELVIMRAAGLSAWQFLLPMCSGAFLFGLLGIFILNPLSAYGLNKANDLILQWRGAVAVENNKPYTSWIIQKNPDKSETSIGITTIDKHIDYRDVVVKLEALPKNPTIENIINNIKPVANQGRQEYLGLIDATFITINRPNSAGPEWRYVAKAILLPGYWLLINPIEYSNEALPNLPSIVTIPTSIQQKALKEYISDPNGVNFYELCDKITMAKTFGYKPYPLQMILHKLIALPILAVAMVLIAAVVSIRFARFNNIKLYMLGGMLAGFGLYLITILSQDFGKLGIIPPIIAAWTPVIIAVFTGFSVILQREDG